MVITWRVKTSEREQDGDIISPSLVKGIQMPPAEEKTEKVDSYTLESKM